jgi:hypothetical protein
VAARSLALACQDAATDQEIAEWLLEIASGRWPDIRPKKGPDGKPLERLMESPPDGTQRMTALKEFLLRRDGQPLQAVALKAEIEARARLIHNAEDVIDVDAIDANAARLIEDAFTKALASANVGSFESPDEDM